MPNALKSHSQLLAAKRGNCDCAVRGSACKRGYDARWRKARMHYIAQHPRCVRCGCFDDDRLVVDHIVPHHGDMRAFWDSSNWQVLCVRCHNAKTATEDGGFGR